MEDKEIFNSWETFKDLLKSTQRPNITNLIDWLDRTDFKFAPASIRYHNCFRGGLLKHSLDVYYTMQDFQIFSDFFDLPKDTLIITALLHDICKVNCYEVSYRNTKNENGEWVRVPYYTWNEQEPIGHGAKSVMLINEFGVALNKIERAMIVNHMGFSNGEDSNRVSNLFSKCPQSLLLHWADEACTFIKESDDLPKRFKDKFVSNNITQSLNTLKDCVVIDGVMFKKAPENSVVDNTRIIEVLLNNEDGTTKAVKVYKDINVADGLPF